MSDNYTGDSYRAEQDKITAVGIPEMHQFLTQETRYAIIQYILAHPEHLMSVAELDYMIPKSEGSIRNQLDNLCDASIMDEYEYLPNVESRDLPSKFFGLTSEGVDVLYEYNFLRGVPVLRAMYDNVEKPDRIERHETAPRPDLPEEIQRALALEDTDHPEKGES